MKSDCEKFRPILHDWLEGLADEENALLAQWHLRQCPSCQRVVAEWQMLASEVKAAIQIPAPARLDECIQNALPPQPLLSWREFTLSWLLTSSGIAFAAFWFGVSVTQIMRSLSAWTLSLLSIAVMPVQWVQQAWEFIRQWV